MPPESPTGSPPFDAAPPDPSAKRGPAAADALAAARARLAGAFDADPVVAADVPVAPSASPDEAAPAEAAAFVARAREAGVVPPEVEATLVPLLDARLQTADTPVDARHRAERAIEWALLAARRRGWDAVAADAERPRAEGNAGEPPPDAPAPGA